MLPHLPEFSGPSCQRDCMARIGARAKTRAQHKIAPHEGLHLTPFLCESEFEDLLCIILALHYPT